MALNLTGPSLSPFKIPDYYADTQSRALTQGYNLANKKASAELPFAARAKESEVIGKELENVFNRIRNQYAPEKAKSDIAHTWSQAGLNTANTNRLKERLPYEAEDIQADIAYRNAQAYKNMQPETGELAKAFNDASEIIKRDGINSPNGKLAAGYLERKALGNQGEEITIDPKTGAVSIRRGGAAGKGGAGSQLVNGQVVTPPSSQIQNEQQSRQLSNVVRDYLADAAPQPFMGQGSNSDLLNTARKVRAGKGSEEDKEKMVQAAVALKLVPEIALQQLNSQGVRATVSAQAHQAEQLQLGWPAGLKLAVDNLPPELQKEAKDRHDKILQNAHNLQTQHHYQGAPFQMPETNQGLGGPQQQQMELTYHEALVVQDALGTINAANPTGKPFNEQDIIGSAAKLGMTPVEFAQYLKDLTIRQQNG